ncbi:hypothetical protein K440DRAFT_659826 [Wilcoxina mikolae CBS 423.85]|nr:hypothetical protein K440DRAFT_659826 [Wilcoxina mikolae CBS 423.85]
MANNNFPEEFPIDSWEAESDSNQHPPYTGYPLQQRGEYQYQPASSFTGALSYEQYPVAPPFPDQHNPAFFDDLFQVGLMGPQVNDGAEHSAMTQESQNDASHQTSKPSVSFRCTHQSCTAKEEDRVFTGKDAEIAYKYICHVVHCPRHTKGFSRQDNWKTHLKTHRDGNKCRSFRGTTSPEPTNGGRVGKRRASPYLGRMERDMARKVHRDLSRLLAKAAQSLNSLLSYIDEDEDAGSTTDKCDEDEDGESDA